MGKGAGARRQRGREACQHDGFPSRTRQGGREGALLLFTPTLAAAAAALRSYWDIMLKPVLDAANAAFKQKGKTFNFGMGGE